LGFKQGIVIGNNVWIGANCSIVAGVTIGDNVTIGAGCVIRQDIPSNTIVVGKSDYLELLPKRAYEWDCTQAEQM
jgi:acetyltransferase-like isoleucine patch superfamily enzyme